MSGWRGHNLKSLDIKKLPELNLSISGDGRGSITFGSSHPMAWMYAGSAFPNMGRYNIAPCFEMIEGVKLVYDQLKRLQRA